MIIIGERLNSSRKKIAAAIATKDSEFIKQEAKIQVDAGAHYLDVNCATSLDNELNDLAWLLKNIRQVADTPFCLDSPNPAAIEKGLSLLKDKEKVFINSITLEPDKIKSILPLVKKYNANVIALTMDEKGVPKTKEQRIDIIENICECLKAYEIPQDAVYFDLLVQPLSTQQDQAVIFLETLKQVKKMQLKVICGLSNVSFGLPKRSIINASFLGSVMSLGIDAVIIDPIDEMMSNAVSAMKVILNQDDYCLNYIKKMRAQR